ncbi:MAG TPA: NAD(P)H-dependent oxidoreductase subunit E, partial [Longimicrobiales bacterium]|nr:NAD(P)H-dependent oxidoreductase subunit E [Longimicrobiales bacterium]
GPYRKRLDTILSRYPNRRAALLPVLNLAHEIRGHLSQETMDAVAGELEESPAAVRGVATFYTMYNKRAVGRHLIQVCTNVSCNLCGGHEVFEAFLSHTGTEPGQISEDGEFTVMEVECLGACGFPTAVQVNGRYFENMEAAQVPDLLDRLKRQGVDPVDGAAQGAASSGSYSGSYSEQPRPDADPDAGRDSPTTSPNTTTKPRHPGEED